MNLFWAIALALSWGAVNAVAGWALCCLMTAAKMADEQAHMRRWQGLLWQLYKICPECKELMDEEMTR